MKLFKAATGKSGLGMTCIFLLMSCVSYFVSASNAQEVTAILTNGDQVTGLILEYKNDYLTLKTQNGTMKIPANDLVLLDFASSRGQVSAKAYRHLMNGKQLLEMNMEEEALAEFKLAIRESPKYAEAYYEIGKLLEKRDQMSQALEYFSHAISINPDQSGMAEKFLKVADNYFDKNKMEQAAETYYLLFLHFPQNPAAEYSAYRAGFLYASNVKDNEKALVALEGAVAKFPKSQWVDKALYEIGRIYEEQGAVESSEGVLLKLILDFPSSQWRGDAHYVLAKAYHGGRRNAEAVEELTKVINESSDPELKKTADQMLDKCIWTVYGVQDGLPSEVVRTLSLNEDQIWVGTQAGITTFDLKANSFTDQVILKGTDIRTLTANAFDLWVGTQDSGIKRYDKLTEKWTSYTKEEGFASDRAFAISMDSNNVWIGTTNGGVYRYNKSDGRRTNYTVRDGLPSDNIVSIASTPSGVWCGTLKSGASFFDVFTGKWQTDPALSVGKTVTSIAAVGEDQVWFAWYEESRNGVSKYDSSRKEWKHLTILDWNSNLISLGANDAEIWVCAETNGLFYDRETASWSAFDYPPEIAGQVPVNVLVEDNSVWFATSRGLSRLDRNLLREVKEIRQKSNNTDGNPRTSVQ